MYNTDIKPHPPLKTKITNVLDDRDFQEGFLGVWSAFLN